MAIGVFGLKKIYKRQVDNIDNKNFVAWSESAKYGYFGGGSPNICTITRLDFSNETASNPGKNLPVERHGLRAVSNNSYGYFGGGYAPPSFGISPYKVSTITRLDFSNETVSEPGKNLPFARYNFAEGVSNNSYGYFVGGDANISTISRLDFSNEVVSDPSNKLYSDVSYAGSVFNNSYGYFGGGTTYPPYTCTITRLDFSNETVSDPGKNLSTIRKRQAGVSNNSYGYFGGGQNATNGAISTITRLDFSNETVSDPGKNLPAGRSSAAGVSNNSYGYFGGGVSYSNIIRLDFSNETVSNPGKNLYPAQVYSAASVSGGASILRPNKTYGYFAGGFNPLSISTISRLDFSTETVSNPGNNFVTTRSSVAAVSNNSYGYLVGGFSSPPVPSTTYNTITRLDFSNDIVSNPGKDLPAPNAERSGVAGVSNNSYGYFGGGIAPIAGPYSTISRLDFSNETVSDPGKNLNLARLSATGVSNNCYGYFGGGATPTVISTISRLDFSNETASNPGNNLPTTARSASAGVSNNSYGYFAGGYDGTAPISTITRLDFSNETVSNPGRNLPPTARASTAGVSNNSYGYIGGGFDLNTAYTCIITRLDFSNETVFDPTKNLPVRRSGAAGLTNSN